MKIVKKSPSAKSSKKLPVRKAEKEIHVKTVAELLKDIPVGVAGIIHQIVAGNRLDGAPSWLAGKSGSSYLKHLLHGAANMPTKQVRTNKYLVITGLKRLVFWKLESLNGDVYTRLHPADRFTPEDVPVRGSLKLLKKIFGADKVKLADQASVIKMQKTLKSDVSCLKAA